MRPFFWLALPLLVSCERERNPDMGPDANFQVPTDATISLDALSPRVALPRADATAPGELDGRSYVLQSATGYEPLPKQEVTLRFENGRAFWKSGCNRSTGVYLLEGDVLIITARSSTQAFCDWIGDQEAWFDSYYTSRPRITLAGDRLTLSANGVTLDYVAQ